MAVPVAPDARRADRPTPTVVDAVVVWVALGTNLGDRRAHLRAAEASLRELASTTVSDDDRFRCSPVYESAALAVAERPAERQPDYLNAVARFATDLAPEALLDRLQSIELAAGRQRAADGGTLPGERWAARPLDLDLLLYGDGHVATARLEVPHPRIRERAFVLRPMLDLDPAIAVPGAGSVERLLAKLGDTDLVPVEP